MRLIAGLLLILTIAWVIVSVVTTVSLRGFLIDQLDQQLHDASARLSGGIPAAGLPPTDQQQSRVGSQMPPGSPPGQVAGTINALFTGGHLDGARVVPDRTADLSSADTAALAALSPGAFPVTLHLSALGDYRVAAVVEIQDGVPIPGGVFVTGLPLNSVEATVNRLELVEAIVFAAALVAVGLVTAGWVRLALRPLRHVTRTAAQVTALPLANGDAALPARAPDADPRTEVGQVSAAVNHMLEHIETALTQRHANEARLRRFIADASHELRTPLAAIRGYAEFVRHSPDPVPRQVAEAFRRVEAASARMGDLVDDLLLLARLDAGRALAREPVDVTRLAIDVTSDAHAAGPAHRWVLELPDEPLVVLGDEHRLHQVVGNLLANARMHTPPGTLVTVSVTRLMGPPHAVQLEVTDDGPGIPPDLQPALFERFVRGDNARSRAAGSTGLGLAIVAAVVAAHGGTVDVASRPGRTTFRIVLPSGDTGPARPTLGAAPVGVFEERRPEDREPQPALHAAGRGSAPERT